MSRNLPDTVEPKVGVFISILDNAAALLANPILGLAEVGRITAILSFAGNIVRDIALGQAELKVVDAQIKTLLAEERGPTEEEWSLWSTRLVATDVRIAAAKSLLGGDS